jgi:hypothetical protein
MEWDSTAICAEQGTLALTGEGFGSPAEAKGLLSLVYLLRHLPTTAGYATDTECAAAYRLAFELCAKHAAALRKQNEAFTCSVLLEPLLDALGWHRIPQQTMPGDLGTRKRPDYCLIPSAQAHAEAAQADGPTLFRLSATVLEAKSWQHPLDRLSERETPGWFPSQQVQDYLRHAKDAAGRRFFDWAILTNGNEWRLYCEHSAVGAHFAFHLVRDGQFCSREEFRLFFTLFRASAFERSQEGACFLDAVRQQSLRLQTELEANLRKRIFGVLEDLGTAFAAFEDNHLAETDYPLVYDKAMIFLYRLLFVLYAESRLLLPVREHGPQANRQYLAEFSLARLTHRLRDRSLYRDNAFAGLYEELLRLFNLINGTHPRQNASLGVTRYNGGLFSPVLHPELERWRVGDRDLADVLRQLVFSQPPARSRQAQEQISTDEAIDYSTLEVRQLGDIYEGLLGAHFEKVDGRLELRNENGENHRSGIFYTPDWIVRYLLRETVAPLLDAVERSPEVQRALAARSEERKRDNSFALGVLRLNLVDPAMGSGHFLVRATEWLADRIMTHPTTQPMTMQIVLSGERRMTREEILERHRVPVPPGVPQEQAEKAYWRRRVVEACIHGVDLNPMAVELAKLALWLTCIVPDEPLSFLDHHLRRGNSLLSVAPGELRAAPHVKPAESAEASFDLGDGLQNVLGSAIRDTLCIETGPSTEMHDVKEKERLWRELRERLQPFLRLSDLWLCGLDGIPLDALNYRSAARCLLGDATLSAEEKRDAKRFLKSIEKQFAAKQSDLTPFHWQLEFPDVFFDELGQALPPGRCGFDAVLGNPPYVSIHTAMEPGNRKMRSALERRAGYVEDLYVHFTDLGFALLRENGGFGFIVSDTFFTLASKQPMRELLQSRALDWLGQCDPFDATVDAAIFVARNHTPEADHRLRFVQARPLRRPDGSRTQPETALDDLAAPSGIVWDGAATPTPLGEVRHATVSELRVHEVPLRLFLEAHRRNFFEPRPGTLRLFERFNAPVKALAAEWWDKIEDSRAFTENVPALEAYHRTLRPGDITLVGLVAEGGQGMRTANNARFLAYLDGTPQADELRAKAERWSANWLADDRIRAAFTKLLRDAGGDPARPTADRAAWEAAVHRLREQFTAAQLGFGRTALFRIAPRELVADEEDFAFSFRRRKAELLEHWRSRRELNIFWGETSDLGASAEAQASLRTAAEVSDAAFCGLCQALQRWIARENTGRPPAQRIPKDVLGLRSSEDYADPTDAPRIATVYNGLYGRAQFVPFRKGDPEGNRWIDNSPLFCEWSKSAVEFLATDPSARWQGHRYFFRDGLTYNIHARGVLLKSKLLQRCVFDASASFLSPTGGTITAEYLLCLLNSHAISFYVKKFCNNTWHELSDLRRIPIIVPSAIQAKTFLELASLAINAKRQGFAGTGPDNELASRVRDIGDRLRRHAPAYLRPSAQGLLLATPDDCLEVIQRAVNWEAEKLYGVEGQGPFDEF